MSRRIQGARDVGGERVDLVSLVSLVSLMNLVSLVSLARPVSLASIVSFLRGVEAEGGRIEQKGMRGEAGQSRPAVARRPGAAGPPLRARGQRETARAASAGSPEMSGCGRTRMGLQVLVHGAAADQAQGCSLEMRGCRLTCCSSPALRLISAALRACASRARARRASCIRGDTGPISRSDSAPSSSSNAPTWVRNVAASATLTGPHGCTAASHRAVSGSAALPEGIAQPEAWTASPRRPGQ